MAVRTARFTACAAAVALCGWTSSCAPRSTAPTGPAARVVLISCDTLRADRLGHYGYERPVSPRLDAFAREGVVFQEAYATAPMTQPAVSSMLTGLLPLEIGVTFDNHLMIPPEVQTLAEELGDHGIPSQAVVSNFVLRRPRTAGHDAGVHQGFAIYDDEMSSLESNRISFERTAGDTTDAAIRSLDRVDADEPFFLWVHYQDPHGPYTPPAEFAERFEREPETEERIGLNNERWGKGGIPEYQRLDGEQRPDVYRDRYDAEIAYFDAEVGRFLDALRERGLYDDALIVFTADHGESLGEHDFWFCHGENLHREVVRVPLVIRYTGAMETPQTVERDGYRVCDAPAGHVDLWSTVLGALGVEGDPRRGRPLLASLPERRVFGHLLYPEAGQSQRWGASDGRFRVLFDKQAGRYEFYDIVEDPHEENDLSQTRAQRMRALAQSFQEQLKEIVGKELVQGVQLQQDDETREAFDKLGYGQATND